MHRRHTVASGARNGGRGSRRKSGVGRVEVAGQVTTVSLRHHAIEYRTDSGPAVILPGSRF